MSQRCYECGRETPSYTSPLQHFDGCVHAARTPTPAAEQGGDAELLDSLEVHGWHKAATTIRQLQARNAEMVRQLAECFKVAGADCDGNEDWRIAPRAVRAVTDLRRDYDEACEELHGANGWRPRAKAAESKLSALLAGVEGLEAYLREQRSDHIARSDATTRIAEGEWESGAAAACEIAADRLQAIRAAAADGLPAEEGGITRPTTLT